MEWVWGKCGFGVWVGGSCTYVRTRTLAGRLAGRVDQQGKRGGEGRGKYMVGSQLI